MELMECRDCGFEGDEAIHFIPTDIVGERLCPECGSNECYLFWVIDGVVTRY